jgi:hypothetical protein
MQPWKRSVPGFPQLHRWDPTWDEAVNLDLGVAALASDVEWEQPGLLHRAASVLGGELTHCGFRALGRPPTQYDSPTGFDHGMLDSALGDLEQALHAVSQFDPTSSAAPSSP